MKEKIHKASLGVKNISVVFLKKNFHYYSQIRSKNLDVLFRKDYYAQRQLSAATTSSSAVSSEQGEPPEDPDSILATSGSQLPVPSSTSEQPVVPEEEEEDEEDVIGKRKLNFLFSISRKK